MQNIKIEEVVCKSCGTKEYSKLTQDNLCYECNEDKLKNKWKDETIKNRILELFGENAMSKYRLDNFWILEGLEKVHKAFENFDYRNSNIFVSGKTGIGKSHLCKAVSIKNLLNGNSVWYGLSSEFGREFRGGNPYEEKEAIFKLSNVKVLVVDDLGRRTTDFDIDKLCEIVEKRFDLGNFGMIISSNLDLDELASLFKDDRLSSRVLRTGFELLEAKSKRDYGEILRENQQKNQGLS